MPSRVEKARATYRMYGGTLNSSRLRSCIFSITRCTSITPTSSTPSA